MSEDDAPDPSGIPVVGSEVPHAEPQPASCRPGPHAPQPVVRDPDWWTLVESHLDLAQLLAEGRRLKRMSYGHHHLILSDPGVLEVYRRLELAEAMVLDAQQAKPSSRTAAIYLNQIREILGS
jgi:hypothetical protein